jgi:hypothetical protein
MGGNEEGKKSLRPVLFENVCLIRRAVRKMKQAMWTMAEEDTV